MSPVRAVRERLVAQARRHSRVPHEVEDLAHDIILSALRRGLALEDEAFARTLRGAARQHGAFLARSAGRRRARELLVAGDGASAGLEHIPRGHAEGAPLSALPPALRTTLLLLCLGLDKAELRMALGVTDPTLRKRFQALRARAPLEPPRLVLPVRTPALRQLRRAQVDQLPRLAGLGDRRAPRVLAASDPDGHGLIFAEVFTSPGAAATPHGSAHEGRSRSGESPCSSISRTSPSSSSSRTSSAPTASTPRPSA